MLGFLQKQWKEEKPIGHSKMGKQNAAIPQDEATKSCRHSLFFHNEPYMIDEK